MLWKGRGQAKVSGGRLEFSIGAPCGAVGEGICGQRDPPSKVLRVGPAFPESQSVHPHHPFAHSVHQDL